MGGNIPCTPCIAERHIKELGGDFKARQMLVETNSLVRKAKRQRKALGRAKAALLDVQRLLDGRLAVVSDLNNRIKMLEGQLMEARRRTIPLYDGSELNFLPLYISKIDVHHDTFTIRSANGAEFLARGTARATIEVEGETMSFTPKAR